MAHRCGEFKWYEGITVHKLYLSAIFDLYDRRIVSYVLSEHNDTPSPDLTDPTDTSTGEKNSVPALIGGVTRPRDGAMELSDGLKEFDEQGVQKLVDAFAGDLSGLMDWVDAVKAVPERYNSFSGISPDMDGQTKIV